METLASALITITRALTAGLTSPAALGVLRPDPARFANKGLPVPYLPVSRAGPLEVPQIACIGGT